MSAVDWYTSNGNTLAASILFIAVIVSDSLTAVETTSHADVPASLRCTSLVLMACFAAPLVRNKDLGYTGWLQRPILAALLVAVASLGEHHGGPMTRAFDAATATVVLLLVTWAFSSGGFDENMKEDNKETKRLQRAMATGPIMLAVSMMLYGNLRILRAGLLHSTEASKFKVYADGIANASSLLTPTGYAYASDMTSIAVSAGAGLGIGASAVVAVHARELAEGTRPVALQMGAVASFQVVAALAASMGVGTQMSNLPAIFGETACRAADGICQAAATSRRFAIVNTPAPSLWMSALGMFAIAYPRSVRFRDESEVTSYESSWWRTVLASTAAISSLLIVFASCTFSGPALTTELTLLASIAAIYVSSFWSTLVGSLIHCVAMVTEEAFYVSHYGAEELFSHLTHLTLVLSTSLLILHSLLDMFSTLTPPTVASRWWKGIIVTAGTSLSSALYCASACLLMVTNGSLGELQDTQDGRWFAKAFVLQHFVPFLVWAPLHSMRCDVNFLTWREQLVVWVLAIPVLLVLYGMCLLALDIPPPTAGLMDIRALAGGALAFFLPWAAAGFA